MRLNYACYQDARFILVATPSGITLGPEGGAHQSINPPLIALGQPGLRHYEPAFADELAAMMEEAFRLIDDPNGEFDLFPPVDALDRADRAIGRELARGRARRRLLAAAARYRRRGGDRRDGRGDARSAGGVGRASRRRSRARATQHHLAQPASPRLDPGAGRALGRAPRAQPCRDSAVGARARRRPGDHRRRRPRVSLVARRSARPARRAARESIALARPAACPTSTPPTGSTRRL